MKEKISLIISILSIVIIIVIVKSNISKSDEKKKLNMVSSVDIERIIKVSEDGITNRLAFSKAIKELVNVRGRCSFADFITNGGWTKKSYSDNYYFVFCSNLKVGDNSAYTISHRVYLNVDSGKISYQNIN